MVAVDPGGRWNLHQPVIPGDDEDRVAVAGELRRLLEVGPERRVRVEDGRVDLPVLAVIRLLGLGELQLPHAILEESQVLLLAGHGVPGMRADRLHVVHVRSP